ncbi:phytoene/squalene synthase family protein [Kineosporia mesophila]|uniref:Phytoene/squalene synthase family protein n=1 Tax=Kineosporia mesophila TaxID=566012 RepID=A0ABP7A774_9ACTN|nr:phytoene/squalene synthase family protein [Kineosporia mesophila]MCD5351623.1 phytoene/squalene synthase family protein [Kineosporia mesophila]
MPRVSDKALDAARIGDLKLRAAYEHCRRVNAEHGKTYYLATMLLPPEKRPYVWAQYAFARSADEFVDSLVAPNPAALETWGNEFLEALSGGVVPEDPATVAMLHTVRRWQVPRVHIEAFLESMQMDATITGYQTYADLEQYMYGSAAVIGLQMLPILEPQTPEASARARALGEAFQMSNFIRDVGEDLQRGRVYLPQEDLDSFGVTREALQAGEVTPMIRELLKFEIERTRRLYAFAEPGIEMLHPTSQDCVRTAFVLYGEILDAVEKIDYQVLSRRASVPLTRRLSVALPAARRASRARKANRQIVLPSSPSSKGSKEEDPAGASR